MLTALIDYDSGNLHSAAKAFERMAREEDAGVVCVTSDPEVVAQADRVVLPGDGAFPACRTQLVERTGLFDALTEAVEDKGRPFLGICVGMQLMATVGREHRDTPGLDWIPGEVVRLAPNDDDLKIPHMGWNELTIGEGPDGAPHPVFAGIEPGAHAYFVHSYHLRPREPYQRLAHVAYGEMVTAAVGKANMVGTQFHPEKSQATGLRLIANFLAWKP